MDFMKHFDASDIVGAEHRASIVALADVAFRVSKAQASAEAEEAKAALISARAAVDALYASSALLEPIRWLGLP